MWNGSCQDLEAIEEIIDDSSGVDTFQKPVQHLLFVIKKGRIILFQLQLTTYTSCDINRPLRLSAIFPFVVIVKNDSSPQELKPVSIPQGAGPCLFPFTPDFL